jgi:serine/threonine-protein kinase
VAVTLEQFVQHLTKSGLMSAAEVTSFQDALPPQKRPKDGETLARQLVQANKLTKYQAQVVYQGKVKGLVFGEYVVLDKLGEGGMGVVLKAEHRRMKRVVAVKMISAASLKSPDAVKRFYREVEVAAKLEHPNIVAAYDASEHEGVHYLVMQFVDGKDLSAVVTEKGPLPIAQAVDYVIQAARGLQYAHEQGIIHRDIKPANLLVDTKGAVKILDMGLARVAGLADQEDGKDRLTASGQVMGTLDYMAPEQAMDTHHVDARADIYSLGCTLYRLLTGEVLFKGDSLARIIWAHQQAPIPSLCKARSDVPPQLDAVFQKMVAKKPEERQQSMTDVIAALETCVDKRSAPATSLGEESTVTFQAADNLSFLQGESPRRLAMASKQKAEKLAAATLAHRAAAAETSKQLAGDEGLLAAWRKKKTPILAIGCGLLGVLGIVALVVTIRVRHPDGKETVVSVPSGSKVRVNENGDVDVTVKAEVAKPVAAVYGPDAPPPAVAPFDAAKAKQYQEAWAKHLGVTVEQTNSISMKLALIPPGEFEMGSTDEEIAREEGKKNEAEHWYFDKVPSEAPRHHVKITKPFYLATYQVTQGEYEKVMGVNPSAFTEKQMEASAFKPPLDQRQKKEREGDARRVAGKDTSRHPVETVNWDDAMEFCRKLSAMPAEQTARRVYRLPTEAEWEYACRAGTTTQWYCGDDEAGLLDVAWFNKNAGGMTHPVGQKRPNAWGLYDMSGNVFQWCGDWCSKDYYAQSPPNDPIGPPTGFGRVLRGGTWIFMASACRSAYRDTLTPACRNRAYGFRVVCEVVALQQEQPTTPAAASSAVGPNAPPAAVAPFDATQAKQHQEAWAKHLGVPVEQTNSLGMPLVFIPPGEFEMGSTPEEVQWALEYGRQKEPLWYSNSILTEVPRHRVKITKPFYIGMYLVTQAEYQKVMGTNPSAFTEKQVEAAAFKPPLDPKQIDEREDALKKVVGKDTSRHPVESVNWDEAMEFCRRLSAMPAERTARRVYRLPTEAEFEYACRAGTTTRWYSGDDEAGLQERAWYNKNSGFLTHPVGEKRPNAWGLYDISGNVWQWCGDWFSKDYYAQSPPSDPTGPTAGFPRVLRGGSWLHCATLSRSAFRSSSTPAVRSHVDGFRVVVGR